MKKKVLYIGGFCMPDGNAAAQRVLGIAKILKACDFKVKFCGLTKDEAIKREKVEEFPYINYPYPKSPSLWIEYLTGRDNSIKKIESYNPDIVILYNHPALAIEHIASFCKKRGIKVIGDVTEWYEPSGHRIFKAIKGFDINRRMYHAHLQLDGLICISSYLSRFYNEKDKNVIELPPLVDVRQPKWNHPIEREADGIRIIYAGSPADNKDRLDYILNALDEILAELKIHVRFDILGISKEQYQNKWNDYKERKYVSFHGRRPHDEVIKLLLQADFQIFLRPDSLSNKAGFPTKFVETITSSTLPITNLNSNLSDYLFDGKNGFVIKSIDKSAIKDTLTRALSSSHEKIEDMKKQLDTETFDYRRYVNKVSKWLESIL